MAYQRGVFWGVVPYTPAAPFSVKFLREYEDVETTAELVREFKRQDVSGELPFSVRGKLRPILALSEPSTELREITALRLINISRRVRQRHLTEDEERSVLAGEHPYLLLLRSAVVSRLRQKRETYAVILDDPVTLNQSAVTTTAIGEITQEEFAVVCERFVQALGLDLTRLIDQRAAASPGKADPS